MVKFRWWMRLYNCHPLLRLHSWFSWNHVFIEHRIVLMTGDGCRYEGARFCRSLARPFLYKRNPFVTLKFHLFSERHLRHLELQRMVSNEYRWVTVCRRHDVAPGTNVELEDLVNWTEMKETF